ncbi:hypothetical protein [Streptomyces sp. JNUCC 63]
MTYGPIRAVEVGLHTCRRTRARTLAILAKVVSSNTASVRRAVEFEALSPNNGL